MIRYICQEKIILIIFFIIYLPFISFAELKNNVISRSSCGLKIIHKDIEITNRHSNFKGNQMPVMIEISELPDSCFIIDNVFLWWTVSFEIKQEQPDVIVVYGNEVKKFKAKIAGEAGQKCWVETGTIGYRADITEAITGNGIYGISVGTSQYETDGLTLLVIYRDLNSKSEGHIYIRDGLITKGDGTNFQDTTQVLDGFKACDDSDSALGLVIVSDMQGADFSYSMIMNGNSYGYVPKFWNSELRPIKIIKNQTSSLFGVGATMDCYSWVVMGIYFQTSTCKDCFYDKRIFANFRDTLVCQNDTIKIQAYGADKYELFDEQGNLIGKNRILNFVARKSSKIFIRGFYNYCGFAEDTVNIRVIQTPRIVTESNPEVFACVMSPKLYRIKLINSGSQTEKVESIFVKKGTDFKLKNTFNLPFYFLPGSEMEFEVEFKPTMMGKFTDTLFIKIENSCRSFYSLPLMGEGLINNSFVSLPDTTTFVGTTNFNIPLKGRLICEIYDSVYIGFSGIISFENSAYQPDISNSINIIQSYVEIGNRKLKISGKIFNIIDSVSSLAVMNGTVLLGKNRVTPLIIEEFKWDDKDINVVKDDGSISVDLCLFELGQVELLKQVNFNIQPNPTNNEFNIEIFNLKSREKKSNQFSLWIYNSIGEKIDEYIFSNNQSEKIVLQLKLDNHPSGLYFVILKYDNNHIQKQLLLIK